MNNENTVKKETFGILPVRGDTELEGTYVFEYFLPEVEEKQTEEVYAYSKDDAFNRFARIVPCRKLIWCVKFGNAYVYLID